MQEHAASARWLVKALSAVAVLGAGLGTLGCEARDAGSTGRPGAVNSSASNSSGINSPGINSSAGAEPERVVQHMVPGPNAESGSPNAAAQAGQRATAGASVASARVVEPISPRHLEAELNRLEAELAN